MQQLKHSRFAIDRESLIPFYKQLSASLSDAIGQGALCGGMALPSLHEMAIALELSKKTVEKAYGLLRDQGMVCSVNGKGYVVINRETESPVRLLVAFTEVGKRCGISISALIERFGPGLQVDICNIGNQQPSKLLAEALSLGYSMFMLVSGKGTRAFELSSGKFIKEKTGLVDF